MIQSAIKNIIKSPETLHVAIIMDGNGRWATARGLARVAGHSAGLAAVRRIVEAAPALGIGTLTLFAFSCDNWQRPPDEVATLMQLLKTYLQTEIEPCLKHSIRVEVIGRRDRLPTSVRLAIETAQKATAAGRAFHLRIALDYSARDAIVRAAGRLAAAPNRAVDSFARALAEAQHSAAPTTDVDLLIRTGGEQRLSDFLLWECAYAELLFTKRMWPDFDAGDLAAAIKEFRSRERRFGGLPRAASG